MAQSEVFAQCYTRPMFARRRYWWHVASLLAALVVLFFLLPPSAEPQFSDKGIVDLEGHSVDPFRVARGKVIVLLFVRTDCPISNRYAPTIQALSAHFGKAAKFFLLWAIE